MRKLLEKFFQHYLTERNLEATLAVLTEDVVSVGTGEQEISRNKGEFRELLLSEFEELPNALEYEICDYMQNFSGGGSICTQLAVFNIRLKAENEITEDDLKTADIVLIAVGCAVEGLERFDGKCVVEIDVADAIKNPEAAIVKLEKAV